MAHILKMSAVRVYDLTTVLNSLTPTEASKLSGEESIKNVKHVDKLIDEMREGNKVYSDLMDRLIVKQQEVAKDTQEKIATLTDEAEKQVLVNEGNKKIAEVSAEFDKEVHYLEAGKEEVEVEIKSDERYEFLKASLPKITEKYRQLRAFAETVTAVEEAKEV